MYIQNINNVHFNITFVSHSKIRQTIFHFQAVHELSGVRLPLQPYTGGHAVFMYSTAADGNVTLQLKEPDDMDRSSLAAMLARLQDDASFSISYQDTDILSDGSIDVLLSTGNSNVNGQGELK